MRKKVRKRRPAPKKQPPPKVFDPKSIPREFVLGMAVEAIDKQAAELVQVAGLTPDDIANLYVQGAAKAMQLAGYDFDRIRKQITHATVCWIHLREQEEAMSVRRELS